MKTECLDLAMFSGYVEGTLTAARKEQMENHLLCCDECLEEFAMLKTQLNDIILDDYQPGPVEVMRSALVKIREKLDRVYEWVTDLPPPAWMLHFNTAAVRSASPSDNTSESGSVLIEKHMNNLRTEMFIRRNQTGKVCIWIKVFEGNQGAKNVSLTLIKDGGRPLARFLNRDYEFFDRLGYGTYALVLDQGARKMGDHLFRIDNKGVHEK